MVLNGATFQLRDLKGLKGTMIELPDTLQEVFNIVATHLMRQNCKSKDGNSCRYRHDGLLCAAGALIPADQYQSDFEKLT